MHQTGFCPASLQVINEGAAHCHNNAADRVDHIYQPDIWNEVFFSQEYLFWTVEKKKWPIELLKYSRPT